MNDWINTLISALPKKISAEILPNVVDDIPKVVLKLNVEQLMKTHSIKNAVALSKCILEKNLSLSKAQCQRVITGATDGSGATLIKLAAGLSLCAEDFFYLYSPQGFDSAGNPIAKYYDIDHEILIDCSQDAYSTLADQSGSFDITQFVKIAVSGYRTIARRKKDNM
ncbi:MAG: hypothetical protein HRT38_15465 [Alteromonadaceae bacterium]|nr:hypothetical protein [Alteromonadaceae bacterium]